jgi:hypothetical protein
VAQANIAMNGQPSGAINTKRLGCVVAADWDKGELLTLDVSSGRPTTGNSTPKGR